MVDKEKLGRGLQSLLGEAIGIEAGENIIRINPSEIQPNESQPRKYFSQSHMETLMKSILENGVLQPIIVRSTNKGYKIIAGERRWRAVKLLGLREIPALVKNADSLKTIELALIENIQREDLNPIEKANAFLGLKNNFGLTQEQIALKVGQERSSVANIIRLLDLPDEVQDFVSRGTISMGHARAILSLKDPKKQKILSNKIMTDDLSVREVEQIVSDKKRMSQFSPKESINKKAISSDLHKPPHISDLEDKLREFVGAKVSINEKNGKGKIIIEFSNNSQFENITGKLETLMKTPI